MVVLEDREGYLHALEGVIAALLVVLYLTSIVSVPEPTDWTEVHLSKLSEDILSSLDEAGALDRYLVRGDLESFNALVGTLDSSVSYSIKVSGIPRHRNSIGVLVNESQTWTFGTTEGDWGGTGLPDTEFDYYQGDLNSVAGFPSVHFVLSDTEKNGLEKYTAVNFDFNDNGDFSNDGEGPFLFHDRIRCDRSPPSGKCSGNFVEVGPIRDKDLNLYNATYTRFLDREMSNTSIGGIGVSNRVIAINPLKEETEKVDVIIARRLTETKFDTFEGELRDFLENQKLLVVVWNVSMDEVDAGYLGDFGFDFTETLGVRGSGERVSVLKSLHDGLERSYLPNNYYMDSQIREYDLTDEGSYYTGNITIRNQVIGFRVSSSGDQVSFETDSYSRDYPEGERVFLEGNHYLIRSAKPLFLEPEDRQTWEGFEGERISADYHVTKVEGYSFNTSDYDSSARTSREQTSQPPGVVETTCDVNTYPYRLGSIEADGGRYRFAMVNFEVSGTGCNSYYEYVYFNFTSDNDFGDSGGETPSGFSKEGVYQVGDTVTVQNNSYEVTPHLDGEGVNLTRLGPEEVGDLPVSAGVIRGNGDIILVKREDLGEDDLALLNSVIAFESDTERFFTRPKQIGDLSRGYVYSSDIGEGPLSYTLDTVWWFQ